MAEREGISMIKISQKAKEQLASLLEQKKEKYQAVRIYITGYRWSGPQLGLALDEINNNDQIFAYEGIQLAINKRESAKMGMVEIDFQESLRGNRFLIQSLSSGSTWGDSSCW